MSQSPSLYSYQDKSTRGPTVIVTDNIMASYLADFSDDRNLVGASQNVFIGKVIEEVKSEGWYTQFAVQVIQNVKGDLQGTVNVGVTGGTVMESSTWRGEMLGSHQDQRIFLQRGIMV